MKQVREKKIGSVFVILIKLKTVKLFCVHDRNLDTDLIFVNSNLDRRQRGNKIRRGLKIFRKREVRNEQ